MANFKDQFKLLPKSNLKNNSSKHESIEENDDKNSFYPYNKFSKLEKNKSNTYRDGNNRIKEWSQNEIAPRKQQKNTVVSFADKNKNNNALAGSNAYLNSDIKNRYIQGVKYKNNDFLENTYIRPEAIDGSILPNGIERPVEISQEERRGYGVNSIRLQSEGKINETGQQARGYSLNPDDVSITKYPQKKYYTQTTESLLKTTGAHLKPEYRETLNNINTNRSVEQKYHGVAKSIYDIGERRYEDTARHTIKEDLIDKKQILNPFSRNTGPLYRNNQPTNPTQFEKYIGDTVTTNPRSYNDKQTYRNNQPANPTQFEEYIGDTITTNVRSYNNRQTHRNNQPTNPTQFEEYSGNIDTTNPRSTYDRQTHRNNQPANPTQFEEYIGDTITTNPKSTNNRQTHRNNQPAKHTQFEEYSGNIDTTNPRSTYDRQTHRNNQPANMTNRELYADNSHNGHGFNKNSNYYYHNNQPANLTQRDDTNKYNGPGSRPTNLSYIKQVDKTRSGVIEEVLPKNYKGISGTTNNMGESRKFNFENNTSIENSINIKRKFNGGADQIPQGKDNIGEYSENDHRGKNNQIIRGSVYKSYKKPENVSTKRFLLNKRVNTDNPITTVLNGNPYVNNIKHLGLSDTDKLGENTNLSDRDYDNDEKVKPLKYNPNVF